MTTSRKKKPAVRKPAAKRKTTSGASRRSDAADTTEIVQAILRKYARSMTDERGFIDGKGAVQFSRRLVEAAQRQFDKHPVPEAKRELKIAQDVLKTVTRVARSVY